MSQKALDRAQLEYKADTSEVNGGISWGTVDGKVIKIQFQAKEMPHHFPKQEVVCLQIHCIMCFCAAREPAQRYTKLHHDSIPNICTCSCWTLHAMCKYKSYDFKHVHTQLLCLSFVHKLAYNPPCVMKAFNSAVLTQAHVTGKQSVWVTINC